MTAASASITPICTGAWMTSSSAATSGEKRVAFDLDCCNGEAISFVGTAAGHQGAMMLTTSRRSLGGPPQAGRSHARRRQMADRQRLRLTAHDAPFARELGLEPRNTPVEAPSPPA